jgi:tetratricopeptide (TPR) repeat protein|tara:strand:+ start:1092 stop:2048 length:957 start_codon:yes stop_codon:yes gene_type:complete
MIKRIVLSVFLGLLFNPFCSYSQDSIPNAKEIAKEIAEENNIKFQEYFFKSLSEKSIKNYQIAIENLEECNTISPNNKTIYFELSKNYLLLNKTSEATQYINKALLLEPTNTWILLHLVAIQKKERNYQEAIKTQLTIVQQKPKQRSELIWLYYLNSEYTKALSLIYMVEKETGLTTRLNQLKVKLELKNKPVALKVSKDSLTQLITDYEANKPSFSKLKKILTLAINENTEVFYKYSSLAIDLYPAQPFAYLSRGKALQLQKKHQQAIDVLEIGIDFVIENSLLEAQFYTTLVKAYTSINNPKKVLEYKIKLKNHKI